MKHGRLRALLLGRSTPPAEKIWGDDDFQPHPDLGDWPLRLLHVPSMTSHEWRPGNVYGKTREPDYKALSYTWGRFELRDADEQPKTKSIRIKGVSWKIPRIDETVFTPREFKARLRQAVEIPEGSKPTEWLWLDIACIDQTPNSPKKAFEIGRQAAIFEKANVSVMWLHQSSLDHIRSCVDEFSTYVRARDEDREAILLRALEKLFQDPWFSSLWTVQEYYICRAHYFMTRDGFSHQLDRLGRDNGLFSSYQIDSLIGRCTEYTAQNASTGEDVTAEKKRLIEITRNCGLLGNTHMPISTYLASHGRNVSHEEDRIYGIMQVFRFRLGVSSPTFNRKSMSAPSLRELEIEFGAQILKDAPYMSQAHVHSRPVPGGQAWRVSRGSVVVDRFVYKPWRHWKRHFTTLCNLGVAEYEGEIWGQFSGYACSLSTLAKKWQQCSGLNLSAREGPDEKRDLIYELLFDHKDGIPVTLVKGDFDSTNDELERIMKIDREEGLNIQVLLLGYMRRENHSDEIVSDETMGILLRHDRETVWRRMGICFWGFWGKDQSNDPEMLRKIDIFTEDRRAAQGAFMRDRKHDNVSGFLEGLFG